MTLNGSSQLQKLVLLTQQQTSLIEKQKQQIAELKDQSRQQQEMISQLEQNLHSAHECIAKLSESDEQLRSAEEYRNYAEEKLNEAKQKEASIEMRALNVEFESRTLDATVAAQVKKQTEKKEKQFSIKEAISQGYLMVILSYAILITWFAGMSRADFRSALTEFGEIMGNVFGGLFSLLVQLGQMAGSLTDGIPDPVWAVFLYWTVFIAVEAAVWGGAGFLIWKGLRRYWRFFRRYLADRTTGVFMLATLALTVFFTEPLERSFHINAVLLLLILWIAWIVLRSWYYCKRPWAKYPKKKSFFQADRP